MRGSWIKTHLTARSVYLGGTLVGTDLNELHKRASPVSVAAPTWCETVLGTFRGRKQAV